MAFWALLFVPPNIDHTEAVELPQRLPNIHLQAPKVSITQAKTVHTGRAPHLQYVGSKVDGNIPAFSRSPKISPPPFSIVDMAQTGAGAYFRICEILLEYKPPSSKPY